MSQHDHRGTPPPPPPSASTSSTFPLSSPSFWTEAAAVALPSPPPLKRLREPLSSPQSDYTVFPDVEQDEPQPEIKRGRYDSPSTSTTLSYLPKRSDFLDLDINDPHSYLSNPEYAPNKFGDIGDYMRKKEIKVQTQNRDIALANAIQGLPQIFKGLSFYINGNTTPPMEELRKMILQRGGEVRPVLRNKGMVKFIIAPMLTQSKFKQFQNYKVVREGWITESCKSNKLLDWRSWKLQIMGGWEQDSRKGMEGFLKSQQTPTQQAKQEEEDEEKVAEVDMAKPVTEVEPLKTGSSVSKRDEAPTPALPRVASPIRLPTATQSLLSRHPHRASAIPISPNKPSDVAKSPITEGSLSPAPLPAKIQKPEGTWEYYYAKESNEHAAQALKNDQWRIKNTAERGNEGGFIDGYYQNSRLHHLSTWKSELKILVADAQKRSEELSLSVPSSDTISPFSLANSALPTTRNLDTGSSGNTGEKVIFHVDFDCFFVSCGLATRPHLKGKPTVVCHSQAGKNVGSTSEIASCSYEARAKGVKNGMSLGRARTLVGEELQTIPYEFDTYKKYSLAFYTVLMGYSDELQAVSVDEALIDVTSAVNARAMAPEEALRDDQADPSEKAGDHSSRYRDPAVEVAEKIRDEVRELTDGCEVSIGISHNILLAKLATRSAKPAGVAHLLLSDIPTFLAPLDVEDFPSIGHSIKSKIEEKFGTTNVEGLLGVNKLAFQRVLGPKTGEMLFGYLRGVDERRLEPDKVRKSISAEMNYGIRFQNHDQAEICVNDLALEVAKRMKNVGVKGKQITLKLMKRHPDAPIEPPKFLGHGWCETFNRSSTISGPRGYPTDDPEILARESVKLLKALNLDPVELRGVGIQVTKLDTEDKDKAKEREVGQGILSFKPKTAPQATKEENDEPASEAPVRDVRQAPVGEEKAAVEPRQLPSRLPSRSPSVEESVHRSPTSQPEAGPSRIPAIEEDESIDPSFLAALPPSLQEEVKRDYAQAKAQNRSSRANSERPHSNLPPEESITRATTVSPVKKQHSAAHITRQLRPKLKTQLKAGQLADRPLFAAWNKAKEDDGIVDLTGSDPIPTQNEEGEIGGYKLSELRELGLDLEVIEALPEDMRREVIDEERRKAGRKRILTRPGNGRGVSNSISPTKTATARGGSLPPINNNKSTNSKEIQAIRISKPVKPALFKSTEIEDVLGVIERWIESRNGSSPANRDIEKVKSWLIKSISSPIGGTERCVETLVYMRMILREKYPLQEDMVLASTKMPVNRGEEEEEEGDEQENEVGKCWWGVWKDYKDEVQGRARKLFGAELKI
ncbi:hypothetical protein I302_105938 [Kwoniella bestiolae CBS 10118]|uniref:DNA repair protein REV1 n=1 Tax=Kwoniella bestiolae CBS 10118 TaxID=1296100 RepID=A0A1B9G2J6_9TREE|nr:hypothetical protein I302_05062 [Kwoniella bestiolae CBS 10118]OCF25249.1 hypothetical protein I302_05062 [Kwoniella bestiolae CBS 10118]